MTSFIRFLLFSSLLSLAACGANRPQNLIEEADEPQTDSTADIYVKMGVEYMRRGNNKVALSKLNRALEIDSSEIKAHNALAILYERLNELEQAEYHYKRALYYRPNDSASNSNYGNFICRQQGFEVAESYFLTAAANPLYKTPELPYTNAGICALRADVLDKAGLYLDKALRFNPYFDKAHYQMAELKQRLGEYETAENYYLRYVERNAQSAESLWLGIRISEALGQLDRASSYALLLKSRYPESEQTQALRRYYNQD